MPSVQGGVSALVAMELRRTQSGQTCLWQDKTGVKECRFFFTLGYSMLEKEIRKPCYVCLILLENSIISSDYRTVPTSSWSFRSAVAGRGTTFRRAWQRTR